jgi:hypothetical protein
MRFASADAPPRPDYIEVVPGVSVLFDPEEAPEIVWGHVDGPLLYMRNGQLHWLTLWERLRCWLYCDNAYTLERKHSPDFVNRWLARANRAALTAGDRDDG